MGLLTSAITFVRYQISGQNYVRIIGNGCIKIHHNVRVYKSRIFVYPGASLIIENGSRIENASITVVKGECRIGANDIIQNASIIIEDGKVSINHHTKVCCKRVWVRFGGELNIGEYTNINDGSEIRCDEKVAIGAFNQISYNVRIWDTNTHSILEPKERRLVTIEKFPYFGYESSRPKTAPVKIGDDCWIGEQSAILKGSIVGNRSIIGFRSLIVGDKIPADSKVITDATLRII